MNKPLSISQRRQMRDYIKRVAQQRKEPLLVKSQPIADEDLLELLLVAMICNQVAPRKLVELLRDDLRLNRDDCASALIALAVKSGALTPVPVLVIETESPINGSN